MPSLTELAETKGLISPEAISKKIGSLPKRQFYKFVDQTMAALVRGGANASDVDSPERTTFLASSSIRSDYGCREWDCRTEKLLSLAHYSVLYADSIILPVYVEDLTATPEVARRALADLYFKHSILRPLVDEDLARFELDLFCFCEACGNRFRNVMTMHDRQAFDLYAEKFGEIGVVYRPATGRRPWSLEITGPEDYVPHGELHLVSSTTKPPEWAPKRMGVVNGKPGITLSASRLKRYRIASELSWELSKDAVFQQYYGLRFKASYLTDSILETEFLRRIYPRRHIAPNLQRLLSALTATIPVLTDMPLRTVLQIRKHEADSFLIDRKTLKDILREHTTAGRILSDSEARDIAQDMIAPQLAKLRIEAKAKRRSLVKKSIAKAVVPVGMLSVGVIAGLIPRALSEIFKWSGIALSAQIAETLASIEKDPSELRSHNFYFLYRLSREHTQ